MFLTYVKYPMEIIHIYGRKDCQKTRRRAAFAPDLSLSSTLLIFSNEEPALQIPDIRQ